MQTGEFLDTILVLKELIFISIIQKVNLVAAARCNMFSHALIAYQNALQAFATKAEETLVLAISKLEKVDPYDFGALTNLEQITKKSRVLIFYNSFFFCKMCCKNFFLDYFFL